jgi:hypothetical protein
VNDVDGVARSERLRKNVVDSSALEYGANWTTGDNTGTSRSRTKKYNTSGCFTLNWVRDGRGDAWNAEEVLLRFLNTLCDCSWNFLGLAVTDTDHSVSVADNYESGERETTSTLNHLRNTVDGYNALEEWALGVFALATLATWATLAAATTLFALVSIDSLTCWCSSGFGCSFS